MGCTTSSPASTPGAPKSPAKSSNDSMSPSPLPPPVDSSPSSSYSPSSSSSTVLLPPTPPSSENIEDVTSDNVKHAQSDMVTSTPVNDQEPRVHFGDETGSSSSTQPATNCEDISGQNKAEEMKEISIKEGKEDLNENEDEEDEDEDEDEEEDEEEDGEWEQNDKESISSLTPRNSSPSPQPSITSSSYSNIACSYSSRGEGILVNIDESESNKDEGPVLFDREEAVLSVQRLQQQQQQFGGGEEVGREVENNDLSRGEQSSRARHERGVRISESVRFSVTELERVDSTASERGSPMKSEGYADIDMSFDDRESVASRDGTGGVGSSMKSITSQSDLEAIEQSGAFRNMHGYLMKRTPDGFSGWQPRYFHLSENGVLSCYVSKNDYDKRANVEGQINVRDIESASLDKLKDGTDGSCTFEFEVQGKQFELECPSPASASEWACSIHTLAVADSNN